MLNYNMAKMRLLIYINAFCYKLRAENAFIQGRTRPIAPARRSNGAVLRAALNRFLNGIIECFAPPLSFYFECRAPEFGEAVLKRGKSETVFKAVSSAP